MKKQISILTLGLGLVSSAFAFTAPSGTDPYLDLYRDSVARPKPLSIVWPTVSQHDRGTELDLMIVIDATGRPSRITSLTSVRPALMRALTSAVAKWQFAPRLDANGVPIKAKVRLPVAIH